MKRLWSSVAARVLGAAAPDIADLDEINEDHLDDDEVDGDEPCENCDGVEGMEYCPECHRVDPNA